MRLPLSASLLAVVVAAPLAGMDTYTVGPRAMGMGGAATAVSDDHAAQFYNPAMFGFFSRTGEEGARLDADPNYIGRKDWGLGVADATIEVDIRGSLANYVQQIAEVDFTRLSNLGSGTPEPDDLKAAMAVIGLIGRFTPDRDTVALRANVGVLDLRAVHVGIGFRQFAEGVVSVADLDTTNIGFGTTTDITANITAITPDGWTPGYTPVLITGAAATNVLNALIAAGGSGDPDEALSKLDYAAVQAGLTQADIDALSAATGGVLVEAINASAAGGSDITANTTAVFTGGFTVAEMPLTFGYALNDHLAFGANLKLMVGRVAGAKIRLMDDLDEVDQLLQDAFADSVQTVTAGVDLGVALRGSWYQVGLNARNLNRPLLKGGTFQDGDGNDFTVDDVTLDPQLRAGVALFPFETLCVTADIDVLENSTTISSTSPATGRTLKVEYATQQASLGAEWNLGRFLALRGGVSKDLAESEAGLMVHAGLGVNLWLLRLDLAAAMATEKVTVDGTEYPRAAGASLGLAMDF